MRRRRYVGDTRSGDRGGGRRIRRRPPGERDDDCGGRDDGGGPHPTTRVVSRAARPPRRRGSRTVEGTSTVPDSVIKGTSSAPSARPMAPSARTLNHVFPSWSTVTASTMCGRDAVAVVEVLSMSRIVRVSAGGCLQRRLWWMSPCWAVWRSCTTVASAVSAPREAALLADLVVHRDQVRLRGARTGSSNAVSGGTTKAGTTQRRTRSAFVPPRAPRPGFVARRCDDRGARRPGPRRVITATTGRPLPRRAQRFDQAAVRPSPHQVASASARPGSSSSPAQAT